MNEEPSHYALNPSSDLVKRASKVVKSESARKGEPKFHMTEEMRRLSTPWSVFKSELSKFKLSTYQLE